MNTDKTKDKLGVKTNGKEKTEGYREMSFALSVFICVHLCPNSFFLHFLYGGGDGEADAF